MTITGCPANRSPSGSYKNLAVNRVPNPESGSYYGRNSPVAGRGWQGLPMSFLDRFKPQPRWKHLDPAIRAAAVAEIPDDPAHRGAIEELARGDENASVRSAAIARVADTALLVRLAKWERDPDLRRQVT